MSQTGYTPILIYGSATAAAEPTAPNLTSSANGAELALNYADGKLFYKNSGGNVRLLAIGYGASTVTPTAGGIQYGTGTAVAFTAAGTAGYVLQSNGASAPSWVAAPSTSPGGATTQVQYNNAGAFAGSSNLTFDGTNLTSGGTVTATKLIPTGNVTAGNGMYLPTTNTLAFSTNSSEAMRILSGGKVLINATTDRDKWDNTTIGSNLLQIERSTTSGNSAISIANNPGTFGDCFSALYLGRSRGTANNDYTVVASGDGLGVVSFQGADGTEFVEAASIRGYVDGTPGANDMPGRLMFFTTPDGSATPTERMRIDSSGNVGIGTTSPIVKLHVSGSGSQYIRLTTTSGAELDSITTSTETYFGSRTNHPLIFQTNNTERMRISSAGNLLLGSTSDDTVNKLQVVGSARVQAAATQDAVIIAGRAGGSGSYAVTLTPATLAASRTLTLPEPGENVTLGYLNIPQNAQTGSYTLVLADSGKHIYRGSGTAATWTIPANSSVAYPVGTALTFINLSATSVSIAITTDTMYLSSAGTTGTRTLAQYGSATAVKIASTTWIISGSGLT